MHERSSSIGGHSHRAEVDRQSINEEDKRKTAFSETAQDGF